MATNEELELRLAKLEQVLDAAVRAVNPPITIGELTDVPAPGSQIAAQWAQEVSARIVHRFATKAALDGWAAADGSLGYATNPGQLYRRQGAVWVQVTDATALAAVDTKATNALNTANTQAQRLPYAVRAGFPNVTTNVSGDGRVNFGATFAGVPVVVATVGGANSGIADVHVVTHSHDTTGFSVRAFFGPGGNNWAPWSGTLSLCWIASGQQVP